MIDDRYMQSMINVNADSEDNDSEFNRQSEINR